MYLFYWWLHIPASLRTLCLLRYARRCGGCKHSLHGVRFELDHRAALSCNCLLRQQDVNKFTNLQPLCGSCHGNKTRCDGSNGQHDHALAPWMAVALVREWDRCVCIMYDTNTTNSSLPVQYRYYPDLDIRLALRPGTRLLWHRYRSTDTKVRYR